MLQDPHAKRVVFLGPPGAGKGTQSATLSRDFVLAHISTGDILRSSIANGTSMGLKAQSYMVQGKLVPDEVVIGIIEDRIQESDCFHGFLLDGFPRTVHQAQALDKLLEAHSIPLTDILELEVADEVLISRIEKRSKEQNRPDDNPEVFKNRLKVYHEQTKPVKEFYASTGRVTEIDGIGTTEEVYDRIKSGLKKT
jgi:adenylate kinase